MGRTYPRATDLGKVKYWIRLLAIYPVPLIELSQSKLKEKLNRGDMSQETYKNVCRWKEEVGISLSDDLEYKYLLENIGVINSIRLDPQVDPYVPLGGTGPPLQAILRNRKTNPLMYCLSNHGYTLLEFLDKGRTADFEYYLFWLILRCAHFDPLLQRIICDPTAYGLADLTEIVPSTDRVSVRCTLTWGRFFGIFDQEKVVRNRLALMLIPSCILELNNLFANDDRRRYFISELESLLSSKFRLETTAINFPQIMEIIYKYSNNVSGFTSGRRRVGLPSHKDIHILEFVSPIPVMYFQNVSPSELARVIPYGGQVL